MKYTAWQLYLLNEEWKAQAPKLKPILGQVVPNKARDKRRAEARERATVVFCESPFNALNKKQKANFLSRLDERMKEA